MTIGELREAKHETEFQILRMLNRLSDDIAHHNLDIESVSFKSIEHQGLRTLITNFKIELKSKY
jgi:hypothetical protein